MFGQKGDEGARGFPGLPGPVGLQVQFSSLHESKHTYYGSAAFILFNIHTARILNISSKTVRQDN